MWLDKKEWIVAVFAIILVIPGVVYYSFNPHYVKSIIDNPGLSDTIRVKPSGIEDKKLIIKLAGVSSTNYALKLNLFYKTKSVQSTRRIVSETIKIPAGIFNGSFTRTFYSKSEAEKAEIIFIPELNSAKGKVKIEAGIF